jgi:excisionase family DNA binding protein
MGCEETANASADTPALSVLHVARRLMVSEGTVLRRIKSGELVAHRVGRQWRVFEQELDEYLGRVTSRRPAGVPATEGSAA